MILNTVKHKYAREKATLGYTRLGCNPPQIRVKRRRTMKNKESEEKFELYDDSKVRLVIV